MQQKIIDPKHGLIIIETVREQVDNLAQTSNATVKAIIEKYPNSFATVRRLIHRGEAYVRKVVEIHDALKVIAGKEEKQ